jgi:hypothetical protein
MTRSQTRHTNHNSQDGKVNVMEIVLHEIDIVTKEQMRLVKYHNELEDRRLRLMEFFQNSERLEISPEAQCFRYGIETDKIFKFKTHKFRIEEKMQI